MTEGNWKIKMRKWLITRNQSEQKCDPLSPQALTTIELESIDWFIMADPMGDWLTRPLRFQVLLYNIREIYLHRL
jgi:hypothetical protein